MKKTLFVFLFTLLLFNHSFAQDGLPEEKVVIHKVALGETIVLIAKKYRVQPQDIYEFNPDSAEGIQPNMILKIPVDRGLKLDDVKKKKDNNNYALLEEAKKKQAVADVAKAEEPAVKKTASPVSVMDMVTVPVPAPLPSHIETGKVTHEVQSGETLTGLARKYNTTVTSIIKANGSSVKEGLEVGQSVVIPDALPDELLGSMVTHKVVAGETLTGLARKYNTTIEEITAANHTILKRGLQTGQMLKILPGNMAAQENQVAQSATTTPTVAVSPSLEAQQTHSAFSAEAAIDAGAQVTIQHKVEQGETLNGLARKYNTSVNAITAANESKLKKGLQTGQVLNITSNTGQ